MEKKKGLISNIQRFSLHDGPGVRTTVFFQGCPLRCIWCHNPETYASHQELVYDAEKCIGCRECISTCQQKGLSLQDGVLRHDDKTCLHCWQCVSACPAKALEVHGKYYTVEQVLQEVLQDRGMYEKTGGGMTLSGGETLLQPEFAESLLRAAKLQNLHTAVDTSGYCSPSTIRRVLPYTDLFLFDLKHMDSAEHKKLTGVPNEQILSNLNLLVEEGANVEIRIPYIPGCNSQKENLEATAVFLKKYPSIQAITLLGYHKLGLSKLVDFNHGMKDFHISIPSKPELEEATQFIRRILPDRQIDFR